MLSWAVNLLALVAVNSGTVVSDLSPREAEVWQRLQKGFVTLENTGVPSGTAALIDPSGLFIAHRSSISGPVLEGRLSSGRTIRFVSIGQDSLTKLVLLQAQNWRAEFGFPVRVPDGDEAGHGMVFAVLPSGPIRAAFTKLNRPGFVQAERRVIPLNEVQFEAPLDGCAGALLVDEDGELLGVLGATLSRNGIQDALNMSNSQARAGGAVPFLNNVQGRGPAYAPGPVERILKGQQRMGPSDLMVAYSAGVTVLKKVVDGFRSPDHHVGYPSLGLLCKDTPGGGALVQAVQPDSPADRAKIQPGDILLSIAGEQIRNQVDFALVMLRQTAGDKILVHFHRNNRSIVQEVIVGHS